MKPKYIVLIVIIVVVIALVAGVWYATGASRSTPQLARVEEGNRLVNSVQELEVSVARNATVASALSKQVESWRVPVVPPDFDPFVNVEPTELPTVVAAPPAGTAPSPSGKPVTPVAAPKPVGPELRLRGVVVAGKDSAAVINNEVLLLGETIDGMKLVEVTDKKVVLVSSESGQRRELPLEGWEQEVKGR